jgi:hypothetical protein
MAAARDRREVEARPCCEAGPWWNTISSTFAMGAIVPARTAAATVGWGVAGEPGLRDPNARVTFTKTRTLVSAAAHVVGDPARRTARR